jgi:hypothetical protein
MSEVSVIGLDLAKHVFQVLGSDDVTAPLCGSSQTHPGALMASGGGHIIRAPRAGS